MRKQERRAWICLILAVVLVAGVGLFGYRFAMHGGEWASFYGNSQIYTDGVINRGTVTDRYGEELLKCTPEGFIYNEDSFQFRPLPHCSRSPAPLRQHRIRRSFRKALSEPEIYVNFFTKQVSFMDKM